MPGFGSDKSGFNTRFIYVVYNDRQTFKKCDTISPRVLRVRATVRGRWEVLETTLEEFAGRR